MEREDVNELVDSPCGGGWDSKVPANGSVEKGWFDLTVDGSGNLSGSFNGARISGGTCTGNHIVINRVADGKDFVYDGTVTVISPTFSRVKGTRHVSRSLDAEGLEYPATPAEFFQDEWVAEKGGIVNLTQSEETKSEETKPGETKAEETKAEETKAE